jgi:hypothetical protein
MLDSSDWVKLRCFEYELQKLEIIDKEPIIRAWLEEEIEKLKEKDKNGS